MYGVCSTAHSAALLCVWTTQVFVVSKVRGRISRLWFTLQLGPAVRERNQDTGGVKSENGFPLGFMFNLLPLFTPRRDFAHFSTLFDMTSAL